ncbi:MAG: ribosome silencing factor [Gammaproteobacteria bacterium]|nr:ribosome silencing factor [Gammaproteobacteria bacterium]MCW5582659.1 ribosome silencing factor [Gammaproteobacteria bacterium]
MKSEDLRDLAIKVLDEMKGIDIVTMDVRTLTSITDYMVICTGRSTRHVKALADSVAVKAKEQQAPLVRTEGGRESEWVLVDLGDVVVHVMLASTRSFYSLEDLWEPVKELREHKS